VPFGGFFGPFYKIAGRFIQKGRSERENDREGGNEESPNRNNLLTKIVDENPESVETERERRTEGGKVFFWGFCCLVGGGSFPAENPSHTTSPRNTKTQRIATPMIFILTSRNSRSENAVVVAELKFCDVERQITPSPLLLRRSVAQRYRWDRVGEEAIGPYVCGGDRIRLTVLK
jgi:hypothetical protein